MKCKHCGNDCFEEQDEWICKSCDKSNGMVEKDPRKLVEWDIDANLPMYTRDFVRLLRENEEYRQLWGDFWTTGLGG